VLTGESNLVNKESFFGQSPIFLGIVLIILFGLGLGIRLFDLKDPPLDFHPTRQLRSAIIARGMYYRDLPVTEDWKRERAIDQLEGHELIEPFVFESIVAKTYRLIGSEQLWVARVYASLFWIIGGMALYFLASAMTNPDGGVIAIIYYLFLPFGVSASRSFQPDPLMIMGILVSLWTLYRWYQRPTWGNTILAGILAGLTIFIKSVALFQILPALVALLLVGKGFRKSIKDPQVWVLGLLTFLPAIVYYIYGVYVLGSLASQFEGRFFPEMWRDLGFYLNWFEFARDIVGFAPIFMAMLGVLLFVAAPLRAFGIALWVGYGLYSMTFSYHITSHTYYHLPFIPIIALSLAPLAALVFHQLIPLKPVILTRIVVTGILVFGVLVNLWYVRLTLIREDYKSTPAFWENIGELLNHDESVIALTQDYGNRLAYYGWTTPRLWLTTGHLNYRNLKGRPPIEIQEWFNKKTGNKDFFLVTLFNQLDKQPELKEILYENYKIHAEGDGFIVFDLREPLQ
jgi:hypothetical protein